MNPETALTVREYPAMSARRALVASLTSLFSLGAFMHVARLGNLNPVRWEDFFLIMFGVAIVVAPWASLSRRLWVAIFSRAVLLQLTFFGGLIVAQAVLIRHDHADILGGTWLLLAGALPLLVMGRRGLRAPGTGVSAFRATLLASLVFGLADTWALLLYAVMDSGSVIMFVSAAVMSMALVGLYRLKVWGLALCVGANVLIAGMALSGVFGLPDILIYGLAATATIQLLLPLPLVRAMLKST